MRLEVVVLTQERHLADGLLSRESSHIVLPIRYTVKPSFA
jgi:hypothetical protein